MLTEPIKSVRNEARTRFKQLDLPNEFITPNYHGNSIVNVAASVTHLLGVKTTTPALAPEILDGLTDNVRRIVLVIVDAMGYQRFRDALETNAQNGFHTLIQRGGRVVPLTSVFPSTTTAALTALWTGYTPAEHGFVGYTLYLHEFAATANMIDFNPVATERLAREQLLEAGFKPENFLAVPSLPQTLANVGVSVTNIIEQPYQKSALSKVQIRGVKETRAVVTSSDLWVALRESLQAETRARALYVAYWSAVDSISHIYGPSSETVVAEINNLAYSFEREFLGRLSAIARQGTLFLLTADHGQIDTPAARTVYLSHHPDLREMLLMSYAGEPRAAYLYCRQGQKENVRAYFAARLADQFVILDSQHALDAGLFGSGKLAPETRHRIGDLIVLPRDNWILWNKEEEPRAKGRHGGLSEEEMLVPLIAARLDD